VLATTGRALGQMLKQVFPGSTPKPLKRLLPEYEGGPHPEGPPAAKLEDMGRALPGIIPVSEPIAVWGWCLCCAPFHLFPE